MSALVWARTIRGIEWVAAAEFRWRCGARVSWIGHRDVVVEVPSPGPALLETGSADDLFAVWAHAPDPGRHRAGLGLLADLASSLDPAPVLGRLTAIRPVGGVRTFEVVASFLGRRNVNRYEIEDAVGDALAARTQWRYHPRRADAAPGGDLVVRVHLSGDRTLVGVRIADRPMHRRAWKVASIPGTLHPPLAFVLALLAGIRPGTTVLDPCCGAGTIAVEAGRLGAHPLASDIDPVAVGAARTNARAAGLALPCAVADAGRLPVGSASIDRVIVNVPWARAVEVRGSLGGAPAKLWTESARVLRPGGRMIALAAQESLDTLPTVAAQWPVSVFGSHPVIVALAESAIDPGGAAGAELTLAMQTYA